MLWTDSFILGKLDIHICHFKLNIYLVHNIFVDKSINMTSKGNI